MPVQDKTIGNEPTADAEEELRRQQAKASEQEDSLQSSKKLLPFLNAKAEHHQSRIDTIDSKLATQRDKIAKNEAKIEQLSNTADRLEDKNRMLREAFGDSFFIRKFIEKNERRIEDIRRNKIPNRKAKIQKCQSKISELSDKRLVISHKLDRVIALNDTIRSFSIGANAARREEFAAAMDRLNHASINCLMDKRSGLENKKQQLMEKYNAPDISVVDKYDLQGEMSSLTAAISKLTARIEKIDVADTFSDDLGHGHKLDAAIRVTADKLNEMQNSGTLSVPELSEGAVSAGRSVNGMEQEEILKLGQSIDNSLKNVEEQLEDDYNMIDGIINNGSKADLEKARADLLVAVRSVEEAANNPFMNNAMHEAAVQSLSELREQLAAVETAIGKAVVEDISCEEMREDNEGFVRSWLSQMVDEGKAFYTEDGGYKVNPEYYKELPRNDRHIEPMTEVQAQVVMAALSAAGIEFSAASRGNDNVGITVSKADIVALSNIMQQTIGKAADYSRLETTGKRGRRDKNERDEIYKTIDPDYYKSLTKSNRMTRVETIDTAREIVGELQRRGVRYSAVVRKNDTVGITVSKRDSAVYKQIESAVKGERAERYVDPSFFMQSPPREQYQRRMSGQQDGRRYPASRQAERKPQSKGYFSRNEMQMEARRVRDQGSSSPQQDVPDKKKKDQGLF